MSLKDPRTCHRTIRLGCQDAGPQEFIRSIAVRGFRCVTIYMRKLESNYFLDRDDGDSTEDDLQFNATVLVESVDLRAVDAAEAIERALAE